MRKYLIEIDAATKLLIERSASEYFGKPNCGPLAKAVQDILQAQYPKRVVVVAHVVHEPDIWVPQIRLLVVVDGEMDQGLIVTKPAPPPANDYVEIAASVGRVA